MAVGFRVQYDDEYYRIIGPRGEEGELFDIGSPAYLEIGGRTYTAFLDLDADGDEGEPPDPEAQDDPVPAVVYLLGPKQVTEFEETAFEGPGLHGAPDDGAVVQVRDEEDGGDDGDSGDDDGDDGKSA